MYRRRNPGEMGDENQLIDNTALANSQDQDLSSITENAPSRIKEESHIVPRRLAVLKHRVITKAASPKGKLLYWWITVSFLGLFAFLLALVPLLVEQQNRQDCSDYDGDYDDLPYFYRTKSGRLEICRQRNMILEGTLGVGRNYISEVKVNVFTHSMNSTLNITNLQSNNKNCLLVQWVGLSSKDIPLQDCYEFGQSQWFGAYEHFEQYWPINKSAFTRQPQISTFLPHDYLFDSSNGFGSILHPLWLNTNGVGILVDEGVQLSVSMTDSRLCLISQPYELDCFPRALDHAFLNYTICVFDDITQTARYFVNASNLIPRPRSSPSPTVFQNPIWSTEALFDTDITTAAISNYCSAIVENGFNISQLEFDGGYLSVYGELETTANVSIAELISGACRGLNVTAWVHPFVNFNSSNFQQGLDEDLYLPGISQVQGNEVSLVRWRRGFAAVVNFLSNHTAFFTANKLSSFRENLDLSSLKFDAGEYSYFPKCVHIEGLEHPGDFTKAYVRFAGNQSYSNLSEVRVGFYTQDQPVLVRLLNRFSTWGLENGLQSVLTAVMSLGLGGYNFIVPGTIGGSANSSIQPPVELFVRWAQLNTFLPIMQFSVSPWAYTNAAMNHVLALTRLHYSLEFQRYAEDSLENGFPIIRPLWWNVNDRKTWMIHDQFFIGNDFMVAPIFSSCTHCLREVYFPIGFNYSVADSAVSAKSVCMNNICPGGSQHTFNVTLYQVLYFHVL